jgi:ribosomal protein S18 acetylase RimI-like enzyme
MTTVSLVPLDSVARADIEALEGEVFADEVPSKLLTEVLAAETAARGRGFAADVPDPFGVAAFRGSTLIGWTEGYRVGANQFHMLNSGVSAHERRNGVYSQLVRAVISHAEARGYAAVRSLHIAANSPVIIAKLRLGFQISGFEYSEVHGPLVQLRFLVNEARRGLYKARTAPLRPAVDDA